MPRSLVRVYADTKVHGPLFDHRADAAVYQWLDASKKDVAQLAVNTLHDVAQRRFKVNTGHYESVIQTETVVRNDVRIHDGGIVYGPWLEGTSKRNNSTRFKGYHLWRRARLEARKQSIPITQAKLDEFIGR